MFKHGWQKTIQISVAILTVGVLTNCGQFKSKEQNSVETATSLSSVEVTPPPDSLTSTTLQKATNFQVILADRSYIHSLLSDVFGPDYESHLTRTIKDNAINFGGPCSLYEDYKAINNQGKWVSANPAEKCGVASQSFVSARPNIGAGVPRQADLAHACSDLTSYEDTFSNALKKINLDTVPALSTENLTRAFELFYRNHPAPTGDLLDSLKVIAPASGPTRETWRQIVFTVCNSSHWQVL